MLRRLVASALCVAVVVPGLTVVLPIATAAESVSAAPGGASEGGAELLEGLKSLEPVQPQVDYQSTPEPTTPGVPEPIGVAPGDPEQEVPDEVEPQVVRFGVDRVRLRAGEDLDPRAGLGRRVGPVEIGVTRSSSAGGSAPSELLVRLLSSKRAGVLGGQRVAFTLGWSDARTGGAARIAVDYSSFTDEFGGDWGGRVRLRAVERGCANAAECLAGSENVPVRNHPLTGRLTATIPVGAEEDSAVFLLDAAAESEYGDYKRTDLAGSGEWSAGVQSGDFRYSYPVSVPAPPAGGAPSVAMSYSSQALDGLSRDRNTQGGLLGPGWSTGDAFIERRFRSCREEVEGLPHEDLCYIDPNASVAFGDVSGRLVAVSSSSLGGGWQSTVWRLEQDPGWRFELRSRSNSEVRGQLGTDNDGEHWIATAPDGTRYWFGYGRESGDLDPGTTLGSVQTAPVIGYESGEPCNTLSFNWCHQAYRWSLDRVEDANGRVTTMHYTQRSNTVAAVGGSGGNQPYVSSVVLSRIEYGQVTGNATVADAHTNEVRFGYDFRCDNPDANGSCLTAPTQATGADFPDIPVDRLCGPSESCKTAPTFFYEQKLVSVVKYSRASNGALSLVDRDDLRFEWRDADGETGTDYPRLFLKSLQRTGLAGPGTVVLPAVKFNSTTLLSNRADPDPNEGVTAMPMYRIDSIIDELGREIRPQYTRGPGDCAQVGLPEGEFNDNTQSCYASYRFVEDGPPGFSAWHKYVLDRIEIRDLSGPNPTQVVDYDYPTSAAGDYGMAWHSDDDPYLPVERRTWGEYRGFEKVVVTVGAADEPNRSVTTHIFHRGMDGDINTHDGDPPLPPDEVDTPSSEGPIPDLDRLKGLEREQYTAGSGGTVFNRQVTSYGSRVTSGFGDAWQVFPLKIQRSDPAGRSVVDFDYDTDAWYRRLIATRELGRVDAAWANIAGADGRDDDRCMSMSYTPTSDRFLSGLVHRSAAWDALSCDAELLSDSRSYYDGQTVTAGSPPPAPVAPVRGNATATWTATGGGVQTSPGNPVTSVVASTTYEPGGFATPAGWGRPLSTTNERSNTTNIVYTSFSGVALTTAGNHATKTITTTNPLGHATTAEFDIYGRDVRSTEPNGRVARACYDELGRLTRAYQPGTDGTGCPALASATYTYRHQDVAPKHSTYVAEVPRWSIESRTLFSKSGEIGHPAGMTGQAVYTELWEYLDGFGNVAETQTASPVGGIIVSRTRIDSMGRVRRQSDPFHMSGTPGAALKDPAVSQVPVDNITTSDPIGRPVSVGTELLGVPRRNATTSYNGPVVTEKPMVWAGDPDTFAATERHLDIRANVWKIVEKNNAGTDAATLHRYNRRGELVEIVDAAGVTTAMDYNQLGWRTRIDDPNQGASVSTYLPTGIQGTSTDARGTTIVNQYDSLDRMTGEYLGSVASGNRLATYGYDTVTGAIGQLVTTDSFQPAGTLVATEKTTAVDYAGRKNAWQVTVPAAPASLRGPHLFGMVYNQLGAPTREQFPGVPGSNQPDGERTFHRSSTLGQPEAVFSNRADVAYYVGTPTNGIAYRDDGKLTRTPLTAPGQEMWLEQYYNDDNRLGYATAQLDLTPGEPHDWLTLHGQTYDAPGNPVTRLRVTGADQTEFECYGYDTRQRLNRAYTSGDDDTCAAYDAAAPAPYNHSYSYDRQNRFVANAGRNYSHSASKSGCANGTRGNRPHAVSSVTAGGGLPAESLTYTCTGAMASRVSGANTWSYGWDERDRLASVQVTGSLASTNVYTASGQRIVRRDPDGTTAVYLGNTELRQPAVGAPQVARFYGHGVIRTETGAVTYQAAEHQGSIVATLEPATGAKTQTRYHPYGNRRSGLLRLNRGFLNKTEDTRQAFSHLDARSYQDTLATFSKPDPLLNLSAPASLNPYIYAHGNPLAMSDPTGLMPTDCSGCGYNSAHSEQAQYDSQPTYPSPAPGGTSGNLGGGGDVAQSAPPPPPPAIIENADGSTTLLGGPGSGGPSPSAGEANCQSLHSNDPTSACYVAPEPGPNFWTFAKQVAEFVVPNPMACIRDPWSATCGWEALSAVPWTKAAGAAGKAVKARRVANATESVDDFVDLASSSRRTHILYGDKTGGGHLWPGQPGKTPFPKDWSGDRVMHEISDVATDPGSVLSSGRGGSVIARGTRGGVDIEVIVRNDQIITGYPTNLPRNP